MLCACDSGRWAHSGSSHRQTKTSLHIRSAKNDAAVCEISNSKIYCCAVSECSSQRRIRRNSRDPRNREMLPVEADVEGEFILHEISAPEIKNAVWEKFRAHHYTPEKWNKAARVFLATETLDGQELIVG